MVKISKQVKKIFIESNTLIPDFLKYKIFEASNVASRPESLRVLLSILAVSRTAFFWAEISQVVPEVNLPGSWHSS